MLGDLTGLAKRLENGQRELNERLDRIIELLESIRGDQLIATEGSDVAVLGPRRPMKTLAAAPESA